MATIKFKDKKTIAKQNYVKTSYSVTRKRKNIYKWGLIITLVALIASISLNIRNY